MTMNFSTEVRTITIGNSKYTVELSSKDKSFDYTQAKDGTISFTGNNYKLTMPQNEASKVLIKGNNVSVFDGSENKACSDTVTLQGDNISFTAATKLVKGLPTPAQDTEGGDNITVSTGSKNAVVNAKTGNNVLVAHGAKSTTVNTFGGFVKNNAFDTHININALPAAQTKAGIPMTYLDGEMSTMAYAEDGTFVSAPKRILVRNGGNVMNPTAASDESNYYKP